MKQASYAVAFILALLFSTLAGTQVISLAAANPVLDYKFGLPPTNMQPQTITVVSPENDVTYASNNLPLSFNVSLNSTKTWYDIHITTVYYTTSWQEANVTVYEWKYYDLYNLDPSNDDPFITEFSHELNLTEIPEGKQNITITVLATGSYIKDLVAYSFITNVSSFVSFTVDTIAPSVSILSPENKSYNSPDVSLNFTVNALFIKTSYVLDDQENMAINGNTTLSGLSNGLHNVTIYAWDTAGNVGASETIAFTVTPFPTVPVVAASMASIAVVIAGLLVYFKKRKR